MEKQDIVKQTKELISSPPGGLYFLYGGEEFLKRRFLSDLKAAVIPADTADLNYTSVTGPDQADRVLETAYMLPQFSDARMIVWYGSGYPMCQQRFKKKTDEVIETACKFPHLHLVIYTTPDEFEGGSREERAALSKIPGTVLFFDRLTKARVLRWVIRHVEAEGRTLSEADAGYLIDRAGTDMTELYTSVAKLCAYAAEKNSAAVTRRDIDELVPERTEFSAFFISDNIRRRDPSALLSYVSDARSRAEKPQLILAAIISEAEKLCRIKLAQKNGLTYPAAAKQLGLNEYVVKLAYQSVSDVTEKRVFRFLDACYEADKKLKTTSSDAWGTLTQLVCSI